MSVENVTTPFAACAPVDKDSTDAPAGNVTLTDVGTWATPDCFWSVSS